MENSVSALSLGNKLQISVLLTLLIMMLCSQHWASTRCGESMLQLAGNIEKLVGCLRP